MPEVIIQPDHAPRRERAIRLTVASSIAAKAFSVACTLAQVPIALRYLGPEAYGLWITLVSVLNVLNFVDFGLGVGLQHALARAFGKDDAATLRRTFWTGAALLTGLAAAAALIGAPLALFSPWADLLGVKDAALRAEVATAMLITVLAFAAGLPFNAVSRLAAAVQQGWRHALWIAAGSLLSLGAVIAAAAFDWGFRCFLAAALSVPVLQGAGLFLQLTRNLRWPLRPQAPLPFGAQRELLGHSLLFALPQTGLALLQTLPPLAIAATSGAAAVTAFNVLSRLLNPLQQAQILFLTPLWPAYTEAHTRGEHRWVARMLQRSWAASALLALALAGVAAVSPTLVTWWLGTSLPLQPALIVAVAAWCVAQVALQPPLYHLIGIGELRALARASLPGLAIATAVLFWPIMPTPAAVLAGGAAAIALGVLPPLLLASRRATHEAEKAIAPA